MVHLTGRCAIITGAAYGIGFAAAERLAVEGARVVIADIKGHELAAEKLSAKGLDAVAIRADVTDVGSVSALVREIMAQIWTHRHPGQQRCNFRRIATGAVRAELARGMAPDLRS